MRASSPSDAGARVNAALELSALGAGRSPGPRSILRLLHVLGSLATAPQGQTLSALAQSLALPKTTLFTMLKVLEGAGYVTQADGSYRLGPEAIALGGLLSRGTLPDFPECAKPALAKAAERTGETAFLAVLTPDKRSCKYVAVVESENWLRYSVKLGSLKPAFATGTGRAMYAHLPADEVEQLLRGVDFERLTEHTVTSRRALITALREVRREGVSVVDGGTVAGVISIAAPIFGAQGQLVAAISIGGPTSRLAWRQRAAIEVVREAAQDISALLGHEPVPSLRGSRASRTRG